MWILTQALNTDWRPMSQLKQIKDAAEDIGCSYSTVHSYCKSMDIGTKVGAITLLTKTDIRKLRKEINRSKPRGLAAAK